MRAGIRANLRANTLPQRLIELDAGGEANEQHDPNVFPAFSRQVLTDDDALHDLRELLDLTVDLRRTDANATGVERRVATSVDDHSPVRRDLGPISVAPDIGILLEVGRPIFGAVGIVPKGDRHARERRGAHQLARFLDE